MISVDVKKYGSLDKALKALKQKTRKARIVDEVRDNKEYTKKSVKKRKQMKKAIYKESLQPKD